MIVAVAVLALCVLSLVALLSAAVGKTSLPVPPWPADLNVQHACPGGVREASSLWQRVSGAVAATIFTVTYIAVPFLLVATPLLLFLHPRWWVTCEWERYEHPPYSPSLFSHISHLKLCTVMPNLSRSPYSNSHGE